MIRRSPAEWVRLVDNARPLLEFVISATTASIDPDKPDGKDSVVKTVFPLITAEQDGPRQDYYFRMLAEKLNVTPDFLRANYGRPMTAQRPRTPQNRQQPEQRQAEQTAAASPFAKQERDPVEEHCLALLLRYPDLGEYAAPLAPEHFWRHENREIFTGYLRYGDDAAEEMPDDVPPGVREQLESLRQKPLLTMDFVKRRQAMDDVVAQLEKRSLRQLKVEEQIRFSESPPDLDAEDLQDTLAVNQRIKETETRSRNRVR